MVKIEFTLRPPATALIPEPPPVTLAIELPDDLVDDLGVPKSRNRSEAAARLIVDGTGFVPVHYFVIDGRGK